MTNGCFNAVRIDGKKENLEKVLDFLKKAEAEGKFFGLLYPIPEELMTEDERFGDEWCVDHWGTQWDVQIKNANVHNMTDNTILLTFSTEWSPPVPFLKKFAKDFKVDVEIRYVADRNVFIGKAICKNGKIVTSECIEKPTAEDLQRPDLDFSKII
jgi:hypothetical protein